ncbi:MAG: MiaB/RimO family radical SAM methylthiotransferase, partial [Verrucomicrobiota bacterium]
EKLVSLTLEKFGMDGFALGMDYRSAGSLKMYPLVLDHTRAFVKIQDGCNLRCSFCLTTVARGASHSRSPDEIVREVQDLADKGCREVVLTGVHAGSYGVRDLDLGALLERILNETPIPRLRLSSLEPWNFKFSWIELWQRFAERLCPHLHMSLQSGSDSMLQRMRRPYDSAAYAEKINQLQSTIPNMAITTDIIVGFPGETPAEHNESVTFVRSMAFSGAHVFTFSPRPGTDAATLPDQLPAGMKKERYREMKDVTAATAATYRDAMIGRNLSVLWEELSGEDTVTGLSENYLRVEGPRRDAALNTISSVDIESVDGDILRGSS